MLNTYCFLFFRSGPFFEQKSPTSISLWLAFAKEKISQRLYSTDPPLDCDLGMTSLRRRSTEVILGRCRGHGLLRPSILWSSVAAHLVVVRTHRGRPLNGGWTWWCHHIVQFFRGWVIQFDLVKFTTHSTSPGGQT
jgi:hypothetical protein